MKVKTVASLSPTRTNDVCPAILSNVVLQTPPPGAAPAPPPGPGLGNGLLGTGCFAFTAPADNPLAFAGVPLPRTFDDEFNDDELIYTIKAGYDFTPDISSYASCLLYTSPSPRDRG